MASRIVGSGGYLPEKILTNQDLAQLVETNDEWITSRTGIKQRHIAAEGEHSSHLAYKAALKAIENASIAKSDIDLIIVCTTTPDNSFPSVATKLQGYLGLGNVPSFDLQAVCSGFIYGMHIADSMLKGGKYKTILLVCSETMSSLLDWQDRKTCVLFGDGAGAVILQHDDSNSGIIDSIILSDGSLCDILYTDGGVGINGQSGKITMNGPEVFRNATGKMIESLENILKKNNINVDDIDFLIPHQANLRIINNIANKFGIDSEKVVSTIELHANCSAASIPLALSELNEQGKILPDNLLVFTAFGAGATWGSLIMRW
jgi:3-oxoacyl-[acyl-carrier-protein] synthase-3